VAQVLLDCPAEHRWLRFAYCRLGHLFPYLPKQPGYNKRLRRLAPQLCHALRSLAGRSPSICDHVRLLDSTPVPCGASRQTVRRSELAGDAAYGYCASHSRWFWGFRLYLLTTPDGIPVDFALAPANQPEREVAATMLDRHRLAPGQVVVADKGFAGAEFEQLIASMGALLVRPDRADEQPRFGSLGGIRQWIESVNDTLKGQLSLERHGGRTLAGVFVRVAQRLLALARPGRRGLVQLAAR
jgi:DDE family transposase